MQGSSTTEESTNQTIENLQPEPSSAIEGQLLSEIERMKHQKRLSEDFPGSGANATGQEEK